MINLQKNKTLSISKKEKGATMIEYAIMASLIGIVSILVVTNVGSNVSTKFDTVNNSLTSATG